MKLQGQEPGVSFRSLGTAKKMPKAYKRFSIVTSMELCQIVSGTTVAQCVGSWHTGVRKGLRRPPKNNRNDPMPRVWGNRRQNLLMKWRHIRELLVLCLCCLSVRESQTQTQRPIPVGNFTLAFFLLHTHSTCCPNRIWQVTLASGTICIVTASFFGGLDFCVDDFLHLASIERAARNWGTWVLMVLNSGTGPLAHNN
jgi:hypothetical protein